MSNKVNISTILRPFGFIYGIITETRNRMYDCGLFKSHRFDIPVISIGNITVGGTGKTPHTEHLIKLLNKDYKIAVLSRGYGRKSKGFVQYTEQETAATLGDEPYQMATKFPTIRVAVHNNRAEGIEQLLQYNSYDAILLDDAFQHRKVKPSANILLIDYNRNILEDCMLPAGRLREWAYNRKRADVIIISKCPDNITEQEMMLLTKRLINNDQKIFFTRIKYGQVYLIGHPNTLLNLEHEKESSILLLSGIASPKQMHNYLKKFTKNISLLEFADHHSFSDKDIHNIEQAFLSLKGEKRYIITTEKDAARLKSINLKEEIKSSLYILPIEIEFVKDGTLFDRYIIEQIKNKQQTI